MSLVDTDERPAQIGDWVLIHVGFALSLVDEQEANETLTRLQAMGADYETELNELRESAIR
ncbi:MAG: hydrogenase assembly chaperone hypC/hupF [Solirubrobacterales bacterium]|nr:hydrogenase assembly chaperone hypC/hupF [Solirubrobacterales bacterium]